VRDLSAAAADAQAVEAPDAEQPVAVSVGPAEETQAVPAASQPPAAPPPFNGSLRPARAVHYHAGDLLSRVELIPFTPDSNSLLLDPSKPHEMPSEEFRTLRTRLNHAQATDRIRSVVITSPSPAEGKSFTAANLAISESLLDGNNVLLLDCDLRRPTAHTLFGLQRTPGLSDYLRGSVDLVDCIKRVEGTNLYIMPAGEAVVNPLEVLNLSAMHDLIRDLEGHFHWTILDSPPLLFAADANLLSTLCSGTILVVRMDTTIIDSISKAMQSLCENNVLGVVVNGARRGELYSKYTYYGSRYYTEPAAASPPS
jgi:receptor protein-tyrosine kinase